MVLVNGVDAWIETPAGRFPLTSQKYSPGVVHPDAARRIVQFNTLLPGDRERVFPNPLQRKQQTNQTMHFRRIEVRWF
jgi:hypothetical protein